MKLPAIKTDLVDVTNILNTNCRVLFKKELQQPSGSFKLRGIGYAIACGIKQVEHEQKEIEVFSSSGGNAGLAAAYSSQYFGIKCTVVLPKTAKPSVIETLKQYNATVHIKGEHWGQADLFLKEEIIGKIDKSKVLPLYCHPFDDPKIWEGHGSMISEIEEQLSEENLNQVKGIICSVGGGGLLAGVVEGLKASKSLKNVPVLSVETSGAPCFEEAIKNNKVVHLDSVRTFATSLASPYVCEAALDAYRTNKILNYVIADVDSVKGTLFYYDTFGDIIEPACGATISIVSENTKILENFRDLLSDDIIIAIVCGGVVTKEEDLRDYRKLV